MTDDATELAFRARALAQAHPLTSLARAVVERAVSDQRLSQPLPEVATWAGAGLTTGYCLRRVEEDAAGLELVAPVDVPDDELLDRVEREAEVVATHLRTGDEQVPIGDETAVIDALDRIIGSEVDKRLEHWRDSIEQEAAAELEAYITWWVVKGYALRAAEAAAGLVAPAATATVGRSDGGES